MEIGESPDGLFLQVQWEGLPDKRDWTWQPIAELYSDVPDIVQSYLANCKSKKKLVAKAKHQHNIPT